MTSELISKDQKLVALQKSNFIEDHVINTLFVLLGHLFCIVLILSTFWFYTLSPAEILSFYSIQVSGALFSRVVEWNTVLLGLAPIVFTLLYLRYSNSFYALIIQKCISNRAEKRYKKEFDILEFN